MEMGTMAHAGSGLETFHPYESHDEEEDEIIDYDAGDSAYSPRSLSQQQSLLQSLRSCPRFTCRGASAWLLGLVSMGTSVVHLFYPDELHDAVPRYIPFQYMLIAVVGFFQCAAGLGLLLPHFRRPAGWVLTLVILVMFPANAHLFFEALHDDTDSLRFGLTTAWLSAQIVLILFVYFASAPWTRPHLKERALYNTIRRQKRWASTT